MGFDVILHKATSTSLSAPSERGPSWGSWASRKWQRWGKTWLTGSFSVAFPVSRLCPAEADADVWTLGLVSSGQNVTCEHARTCTCLWQNRGPARWDQVLSRTRIWLKSERLRLVFLRIWSRKYRPRPLGPPFFEHLHIAGITFWGEKEFE